MLGHGRPPPFGWCLPGPTQQIGPTNMLFPTRTHIWLSGHHRASICRTQPRMRPFTHRVPVPHARRTLPPAAPCHHPTPRPYPPVCPHPPRLSWPWRAPRHHQEEVVACPDFVSCGRKGRPSHAGSFALDVPLNPSLLATAIPYQVGHGHRRRRV
jgi:hypothetical protein